MKISVVIPFYNRDEYLERTLNSVLMNQHYIDSLILVDNCSSDNSVELAQRFLESHPEISARLLKCKKSGAAAARNVGLQHVTTEYVYFFDSDDEMSPEFLRQVTETLEKTPCDLLACTTRIVFPNGREHVRRYGFSNRPAHQIATAFLSTQSMIMRTEFLRKCGGWDERLLYWNDWELGCRLLLHEPDVRFMQEAVFHRIYAHSDSLTGTSYSAHVQDAIKAFLVVKEDIMAAPANLRRESLWALTKRQYIVAGHMRTEGNKAAAQAILALGQEMPASAWQRLYGRLLYGYTALGGRGAWRL